MLEDIVSLVDETERRAIADPVRHAIEGGTAVHVPRRALLVSRLRKARGQLPYLARGLARQITLHGVLMEVNSIGVLITGESGTGKSELALELITRGHRLVADDAPEFTLIAPDVIDGTCPEMLRDLLEVRGLGVLNVREMFGHTAVKPSKYLRLIVHLQPMTQTGADDAMKRLYGDVGYRDVLDVAIPQIVIPVASGRNIAVLAEAAVRSHMLKSKGLDPAQTFVDRQAHQLRRLPPW